MFYKKLNFEYEMANPFNFPGVLPNVAQYAQQALPYATQAYQFYEDRQKRYKPYNYYPSKISKGAKQQYRKLSVACGEAKFIDFSISAMKASTISDTSKTTCISVIPTGDTNETRECKKVLVTGVQIRGNVFAGSTQTAPKVCGFALFVDKTPRGALAAASDVYETDNNPVRLSNKDYTSRFQQCMRKIFTIVGDGDTIVSAYNVGKGFSYYKRMNTYVEWESGNTDGAIADHVRNAIEIMVLGDDASTDTTVPVFNMNIRVYFKEQAN